MIPEARPRHSHRRFDRDLILGGIFWALLGVLLAVLFIVLPDRPYAPAIFLGLATAVLGVYLASPRHEECRYATCHRYPNETL